MSTISTSWTLGQSLRAAATLAAAAVETHPLDIATPGYDAVNLQIDVVIGTATSITVEVLPSVDGGTTVDTTAVISYTVSANDRRTIPLYSKSHVTVQLTNDDGTNASGNVAILYDGRKWASA